MWIVCRWERKERVNMNIYRFINSKDVRKHLEDQRYEFNALEASWLVYQCKDATLEEKNEAWTWIVDNMTDMEVHERINCSYRESLHNTLREYMAMNADLLEKFKESDEVVYTCRYYEKGDEISGYSCQDRYVYFNLDDCLKGIKEFLEDYEEDYRIGTFVVATCHFKDKDNKIHVRYDFDQNIRSIDFNGDFCEEYFELYSEFFDGFWFDFPTPFKKGDIVFSVESGTDATENFDFCKGVLVLTNLLPWIFTDDEKRKRYTEGRSGDNSDMTFYGYFQREDGSIYDECNWNYMDLEYYRGPFNGVRRVLKALSSYVKGDIELELFLHAYDTFLEGKRLEDMSNCNCFTDEGLRLAGLLEEEENAGD